MLNFGYPINKEAKTKFDFYSNDYCYPYFYQDWRLFTPCPDNNFKIYVKFNVGGKTTYESPLEEILKHRNLFNGREALMLAISASEGYLGHDAGNFPSGIKYFPINKYYYILQAVVKNYLNHKHGTKISDLKMMVVLTEIKTHNVRILIDK